jgi:cyanate permease
MNAMTHLKSLTFMLTAIIGGGLMAFYLFDGDRWQGGLLALAVYGVLLAADHLWTKRRRQVPATR